MQHAAPQFVDFNGSKAALTQSIGLNEDELHAELPIVYGSTGLWTLLIPVQHLAWFEKMSPQTATFPSILQEMPTASLHPFCLQAFDKSADMHARHFSSPYSGTIQDIVTGTLTASWEHITQSTLILKCYIQKHSLLSKVKSLTEMVASMFM
ncbi:hypothetical protein LSPH24S_02472 [Lysinibacillus sphaericus]